MQKALSSQCRGSPVGTQRSGEKGLLWFCTAPGGMEGVDRDRDRESILGEGNDVDREKENRTVN